MTIFHYQDFAENGCPFTREDDFQTTETFVIDFPEPWENHNVADGREGPQFGKIVRRGEMKPGQYKVVATVTGKGSVNVGFRVDIVPIPIETPEPEPEFEWHIIAICDEEPDEIEVRVHNLNDYSVQVTGEIWAQNGDEAAKMISKVPPAYQQCPAEGWCGPEERIRNWYDSFDGKVWGWAKVHIDGELVASNSLPKTHLTCGEPPIDTPTPTEPPIDTPTPTEPPIDTPTPTPKPARQPACLDLTKTDDGYHATVKSFPPGKSFVVWHLVGDLKSFVADGVTGNNGWSPAFYIGAQVAEGNGILKAYIGNADITSADCEIPLGDWATTGSGPNVVLIIAGTLGVLLIGGFLARRRRVA